MELFECSECLKLSRERVEMTVLLLGESASPFIGEGDGLTSLERERKRVCALPSLVAHAIGYETIVDAHNIVHTYASSRFYHVRLVW